MTIIYAFNGVGDRESLWLNLRNIAKQVNAPWAIGGDFNCVLQANERLGGRVIEAETDPFYDCIQECGVMDIAATGAFYTWNNKQPPETSQFDHNPCLVSEGPLGGNQHRPFKYFNMWSVADGFQDCVSQVWQNEFSGTKMYKVVKKLKLLKPDLKKLNNAHFSDIENKADIAQLRLKKL
ncbi:uncharacterized protein LOC141637249 [Silene latifolia]|uniref:uncharacterized protein LOC141637249 n=1 Tax=Silene latifolia TaxID=37657 RepID=UPI003D76BFBE